MTFISTGGRAAGRARHRAGALLAAVAVAAGLAASAAAAAGTTAAAAETAAGTPYVYVANAGSGTVTAYDAVTGTVTATIPVGSQPEGVAVSPDGRTAYVTNFGGNTVSVISTAANTVTATIPLGSQPLGMAVSPDGRTVYVTHGGSGDISVISTATNTVTATISLGSGAFPNGIALSPDGRTAYVTDGRGSGEVLVISTATGAVTATIPVVEPGGLAVSPDGRTVYALSFDVAVISTATNTVTATIGVGADPSDVAFSPDGRAAYVTSLGDRAGHQVSVISTATNTVTATIYAGFPDAVAVSRDGRAAYVVESGGAGANGQVLVVSTATNTVTGFFPVGNNPGAVAATVLPVAPPPAPAVTGVSPASGPQAGGTSVKISGTGFTGASAVYFGTVPAARFTVNSATRVTATAPRAASPGTVNVTVITPHGSSAPSTASQYTYLPAPKRADISAALSCPHAITRGRYGACTLAVANAGPDTATGFAASILLPPNLTAVSSTPHCALDPSTASWTLPALASGATVKLTVTFRAGARGRVTVLGEATDSTPDPDPYNNIATARITITRYRPGPR